MVRSAAVWRDKTRRAAFGFPVTVLAPPLLSPAGVDVVLDAVVHGHLRVHAQPIVCLRTGVTVREELLIRVVDGDGDEVLPDGFLEAAEDSGVITMIDRHVTDCAAELAAAGRAVQVNLAAATIAAPGFLEHAVAAVRRHHSDPRLISFEITETAPIADMACARRLAERLVMCGFGIALDDFGSGWGAIRYLKHLPVGMLKIEREFIRDLRSSAAGARLVLGIVALAGVLGQETTAEGVEDEETLNMLRALGVDYAQGFHIARPAPVYATGGGEPSALPASAGSQPQMKHACWNAERAKLTAVACGSALAHASS
jgi:EAL domain-containing protein (putative c-di-GMP-specific phosphodiesterase class I)